LYALFGGQQEDMRHFLRTPNHHLAGEPLALMGQVQGLVHVLEYLDAIRGKV
ncbi:XRE family transcriptional regulator, partial [Pseudomonas aeruginosa]